MSASIPLDGRLLISEGATRRCYRDPRSTRMCLKIAKAEPAVNEADLKAYLHVQALLEDYIAVYEKQLVETQLGPALASELICDDSGVLSASYAEFRQTGTPKELIEQFLDFFGRLQQNNLFFYDFNPKNFLIQKTQSGLRLRYTDLKSLGQTKTLFALERIPFFAKRKLKRRIERFMDRYVYSTATEIGGNHHAP